MLQRPGLHSWTRVRGVEGMQCAGADPRPVPGRTPTHPHGRRLRQPQTHRQNHTDAAARPHGPGAHARTSGSAPRERERERGREGGKEGGREGGREGEIKREREREEERESEHGTPPLPGTRPSPTGTHSTQHGTAVTAQTVTSASRRGEGCGSGQARPAPFLVPVTCAVRRRGGRRRGGNGAGGARPRVQQLNDGGVLRPAGLSGTVEAPDGFALDAAEDGGARGVR